MSKYYRLKVVSINYLVLSLNKLKTSSHNTKLEVVNLSDYEYGCNGTSTDEPKYIGYWQTNRSTPCPHYMVFKSTYILPDIIFVMTPPYNMIDFELSVSDTELDILSDKWKPILVDKCNINDSVQIFNLSYYLINKDNMYYNIQDTNYDIDSGKYIPLANTNGLTDLFTTKNLYIDDLFIDKTIHDETFKPITKFDNFRIDKLVTT